MNQKDIFFRNNFHRNVSSNDVERMFVRKFHRVHNVRYIEKRIYINYSKPYDITEYYDNIAKIEHDINENKCSQYFTIKLSQTRGYPDYIICDGEVFDIPVIIPLDI
jgi:hypothetical protein